MTIWRMRIACWVPKATNTRSVYVTLIAFPTMVARKRLNVTLYVHGLYCYIIYRTCNTNFVLLCIRSLAKTLLNGVSFPGRLMQSTTPPRHRLVVTESVQLA